jgi:hypothetical protein
VADLDLADIMRAVLHVEYASSRSWCALLDLIGAADDDQLDRIINAANDLAAAALEVDGRSNG